MRRFLPLLAAVCLLLPAQQKPISDDESKRLFEGVCGRCHDLTISTLRHSSHQEWLDIVQRMADKGASATDDQFFAIVDYLTAHYGPERLNVNRASADDLAPFFAISKADAAAIVGYRSAHGEFKSLADLGKTGVDAKKFEARKEAIDY